MNLMKRQEDVCRQHLEMNRWQVRASGQHKRNRLPWTCTCLCKRLCSCCLKVLSSLSSCIHTASLQMKKTRNAKGPCLPKLTDWITERIMLGQRAHGWENAGCMPWTSMLSWDVTLKDLLYPEMGHGPWTQRHTIWTMATSGISPLSSEWIYD